MLETYFTKPETIDRIKASWIGEAIERYVEWLNAEGYGNRTVVRRVPLLMKFGEFAWMHGARSLDDLPASVPSFVDNWFGGHVCKRSGENGRQGARNELMGPIQQFLRLVLPEYMQTAPPSAPPPPLLETVPGFFKYLREERGLSEKSIVQYSIFLRRFGAYLAHIDMSDLRELSPETLSGFVAYVRCEPRSAGSRNPLCASSIGGVCSYLRVYLRYLYREQVMTRDLSPAVESPQTYRLSDIPRSISWDDVRRLLDAVERRSVVGRRDYAMLLLMLTYGLRAREVAALALADIDWKRERLRVPERKAGHSSVYPLSSVVGEAVIAYLQRGRPETREGRIFFRVRAPYGHLTAAAVSCRASYYLRKAGIDVARGGSHTFRHTCVQHLVDEGFSLKVIGDYVGHRSPSSTEIYTKVAVETLREAVLGGEEEAIL